jgi:hypothetical protein
MSRRRGIEHRKRRRRRGRTTEAPVEPGALHVSDLLERSAERSRHRWRGSQRHVWGDHRSTAWERRSRAAWLVRALELGGIARRRLLRSIAFDVVVVAAVVTIIWLVAR